MRMIEQSTTPLLMQSGSKLNVQLIIDRMDTRKKLKPDQFTLLILCTVHCMNNGFEAMTRLVTETLFLYRYELNIGACKPLTGRKAAKPIRIQKSQLTGNGARASAAYAYEYRLTVP